MTHGGTDGSDSDCGFFVTNASSVTLSYSPPVSENLQHTLEKGIYEKEIQYLFS